MIIFESIQKQELNFKNLSRFFESIFLRRTDGEKILLAKKEKRIYISEKWENIFKSTITKLRMNFEDDLLQKEKEKKRKIWNTKITIELKNKNTKLKSYNNCHSKSLCLFCNKRENRKVE